MLRAAGCRAETSLKLEQIEVTLTHEALAQMSNVARSTVGALLHHFEQKGLVSLNYRRIRIMKPNELRKCLILEFQDASHFILRQ